ncbi:hypothetical protein SSPIM334S_02455 [Streptomyces spiroverticillatus]
MYDSTTAALPFLFALADDPATPDRAGIVALLLALGSSAVERDDGGLRFGSDGEVTTAYADCAAIMRAHADSFVAYASEPDPLVRRAALEGLGLFLDDAGRAVGVLGERLGAASDTAERLLVVETMATLALRLPATKDAVVARFDALADDPATDTAIRLGALVQRAHCDPGAIVADTVPTAIELLRRLTPAPEPGPTDTCHDSSGTCPCADAERAAQEQQEAVSQGAPPHIAAAFTDLARHGRTHAPTTALLTTFHEALGTRVPERTALLAAQLRSPDSGTRYDAIGMATRLINTVRGDHSALVLLVADCLDPQDAYTSAEAAKCLAALGTDAEPAREALASYVGARRDTHGPEVWAAPQALVRQAHQEAVLALAGLGDPRALPCVLVGLDSGVDSWRAVLVAGGIGAGAGELVPRLARDLTGVDFSQEWPVTNPHALASALGRLGDAGAVPALVHALTQSVRHEQWSTACSALEALTAIGPAARPRPGGASPGRGGGPVRTHGRDGRAVGARRGCGRRRPSAARPARHLQGGRRGRCARADRTGCRARAAAAAGDHDEELRVAARARGCRAVGRRGRGRGGRGRRRAPGGVGGERLHRDLRRGVPRQDGTGSRTGTPAHPRRTVPAAGQLLPERVRRPGGAPVQVGPEPAGLRGPGASWADRS